MRPLVTGQRVDLLLAARIRLVHDARLEMVALIVRVPHPERILAGVSFPRQAHDLVGVRRHGREDVAVIDAKLQAIYGSMLAKLSSMTNPAAAAAVTTPGNISWIIGDAWPSTPMPAVTLTQSMTQRSPN